MKWPAPLSSRRASTTGWRPPSISMHGSRTNCGRHQPSVARALGERRQRVERRRARAPGRASGSRWAREARRAARRRGSFSRASARSPRRQRLVLEGLQLRRDVALGVLHRLAAPVVGRHLAPPGACVTSMKKPCTRLYWTRRLAMPVRARSRASSSSRNASQSVADRAQLVELGVVAGGDHAAVAHQRRRLVGDRARSSASDLAPAAPSASREHVEQHGAPLAAPLPQRRAAPQGRAQAGQLARPRPGAARSARRSARRRRAGAARRAAPRAAVPMQRRRSRRGARVAHAARRAAAASASCAAPGCPCRWRSCRAARAASARPRRAASASARGCGCVAGGRSISVARALHARALRTWRERAALRVLGVARAARRPRRAPPRSVVGAERRAARRRAAARSSLRSPSAGVELPGRPRASPSPRCASSAGRRQVAVDQHLGRREARQPAGELGLRCTRRARARRSTAPSQASPKRAAPLAASASSTRVALVGEQLASRSACPGVTMRTTLRSTGPFAVADVADLLADRDRLAELDQLARGTLDRVARHARHRDRLAARSRRARSA